MDESFVVCRFARPIAVVTGAGSGIGRVAAIRLIQEGARVIATDVVPARLADPARDFGSGQLVTVAGVMDGFLPSAEIDDATWEKVIGVNVTAAMRLTRSVLPLMLKAGAGSIVNVISEVGCRGTAYAASKHAVNGFIKSAAFLFASRASVAM